MDAPAFIPLLFRPGEAYQFDWSHEDVEIAGKPMRVKVAHVRLCASRVMYVRAYPRETQEMLFDAHERAFVFFGGVPTRGIYDNMKTAVTSLFTAHRHAASVRYRMSTAISPGQQALRTHLGHRHDEPCLWQMTHCHRRP